MSDFFKPIDVGVGCRLPGELPAPPPAPAPPAMPGGPARTMPALERQAALGVVPTSVHRKVLQDLNRATREMLQRHGIETDPGATHTQLLQVISRRLALVDFHGNNEP